MTKRQWHLATILGVLLLLAALAIAMPASAKQSPLNPIERLGKAIFFDARLSQPEGQACASCHAPEAGYTGPDSLLNLTTAVYPGAVPSRFGNRKPPTSAYAGDSPIFYFDEVEGLWIGGMFWDGRATGWTLGDPLAEQAQGPFLNPLEHNLPDIMTFCEKMQTAPYATLFKNVWIGKGLRCKTESDAHLVYEQAARSIAAYERSVEVSPYTSKYDAFLQGRAELTEQEAWGLELFNGKGMCNLCHISELGALGQAPLFTDFSYDNLGIPRNPDNPFYSNLAYNPEGEAWIDPGLGGFLMNAGYPADIYEPEMGKHKVPTLRNVDLRPYPDFIKAFGHNGYFKSLEAIVHFYNTRDLLPTCDDQVYTQPGVDCWPVPEVGQNVNVDELGNLGMTAPEEAAIVAFMRTLSDGYMP
jgi:cytochrome c peroxidase